MPIVKFDDTVKPKWRVFVYGKPGTGKTTLASKIPGKSFILSLDQSYMRVEGMKGKDIWSLDQNNPIEDINDFVESFNPEGYDNLIVDNITTIKRNRSYAAKTQRKGGDHKQHARPRPHLRRGHWSHFWTGKRDSADRERVLKWIEPVYINANTPDDLPTTIHRVK